MTVLAGGGNWLTVHIHVTAAQNEPVEGDVQDFAQAGRMREREAGTLLPSANGAFIDAQLGGERHLLANAPRLQRLLQSFATRRHVGQSKVVSIAALSILETVHNITQGVDAICNAAPDRTDDMTRYVALLRAVNVGGTGKLPMPELRAMCEVAGFRDVRTYIVSGNVVFTCDKPAGEVKGILELALRDYAGKSVGVLVRTAVERAEILAANLFPSAAPNRTVAIFLDEPPPADALTHVTGRRDEEMALGKREIYVHYGSGMGTSKLKIPAARSGTARNMNTIATLSAWAASLPD